MRVGRERESSTPVLVGSRVGLRESAKGGGEGGREEHTLVLSCTVEP